MSQQLGGQSIIILRQGTIQNRGKEAQRSNIAAAKAIAGAVRSTLGPRGMDKMLVGPTGDIVHGVGVLCIRSTPRAGKKHLA